MKEKIINEAKEKMDKSLVAFGADLAKMRTGRASLAVLDGVRVDYYGQMVPLNQVATLGVPEPRLMTIAPWEQKIIPDIEKAITKANLGLSPANDGRVIRLPVPTLTEETRKEIVKKIHKDAEEIRVAIRHARRDAMDALKKIEKEGTLNEDDSKKAAAHVQKLTDDHIAKVDEAVTKKEKEVMTV